jgi:hypothetical protein
MPILAGLPIKRGSLRIAVDKSRTNKEHNYNLGCDYLAEAKGARHINNVEDAVCN